MLRCLAGGFRRVWKQSLLSSASKPKSSIILLGTAGAAAAASVLIDTSVSREFLHQLLSVPVTAHCASLPSEQVRSDEQVEMYVDAILGSKMSNIPGFGHISPSYFLSMEQYESLYQSITPELANVEHFTMYFDDLYTVFYRDFLRFTIYNGIFNKFEISVFIQSILHQSSLLMILLFCIN